MRDKSSVGDISELNSCVVRSLGKTVGHSASVKPQNIHQRHYPYSCGSEGDPSLETAQIVSNAVTIVATTMRSMDRHTMDVGNGGERNNNNLEKNRPTTGLDTFIGKQADGSVSLAGRSKPTTIQDDESAIFSKAASTVVSRRQRMTRPSSARALVAGTAKNAPAARRGSGIVNQTVINSDGFPISSSDNRQQLLPKGGGLRRPSSTSSLIMLAAQQQQQQAAPIVRVGNKKQPEKEQKEIKTTFHDSSDTLSNFFEIKLKNLAEDEHFIVNPHPANADGDDSTIDGDSTIMSMQSMDRSIVSKLGNDDLRSTSDHVPTKLKWQERLATNPLVPRSFEEPSPDDEQPPTCKSPKQKITKEGEKASRPSPRRSQSYLSPPTPERRVLDLSIKAGALLQSVSDHPEIPGSERRLSFAPFVGESDTPSASTTSTPPAPTRKSPRSPKSSKRPSSSTAGEHLPTGETSSSSTLATTSLSSESTTTAETKSHSTVHKQRRTSTKSLTSPRPHSPSKQRRSSTLHVVGDQVSPGSNVASSSSRSSISSPKETSRSKTSKSHHTSKKSSSSSSSRRQSSSSAIPKRHKSLGKLEAPPELLALGLDEKKEHHKESSPKSNKGTRTSRSGNPRRNMSIGVMETPPELEKLRESDMRSPKQSRSGNPRRNMSIGVMETPPELEKLRESDMRSPKQSRHSNTEKSSSRSSATRTKRQSRPGTSPVSLHRKEHDARLGGAGKTTSEQSKRQGSSDRRGSTFQSRRKSNVMSSEHREDLMRRAKSERDITREKHVMEDDDEVQRPSSCKDLSSSPSDSDKKQASDVPALNGGGSYERSSSGRRLMQSEPSRNRRGSIEGPNQFMSTRQQSLRSVYERPASARRLGIEADQPSARRVSNSNESRSENFRRAQSLRSIMTERRLSVKRLEVEADTDEQPSRPQSLRKVAGEVGHHRRGSMEKGFLSPRAKGKGISSASPTAVPQSLQTPASRRLLRASLQQDLIQGLLSSAIDSSVLDESSHPPTSPLPPPPPPPMIDVINEGSESVDTHTIRSLSSQHDLDNFIETRAADGDITGFLQKTMNKAALR